MKKKIHNVNQEYIYQEMDSEILVYSNDKSELITLNETAAFIFKLCRQNIAITSIAEKLAKTYKIEYSQALKDSEELISLLERDKIIINK